MSYDTFLLRMLMKILIIYYGFPIALVATIFILTVIGNIGEGIVTLFKKLTRDK